MKEQGCFRSVSTSNNEGRKFLPIAAVRRPIEIQASPDTIQDKCGIVGFHSPSGIKPGDLQDMFLKGMEGVKHRGPQGAGFVLRTTDGRISRHAGKGKLEQSIPPTQLASSIAEDKTTWMMGHNRYGTTGGYAKENIQPCEAETLDGKNIYVAHNGNFSETERMKSILGTHVPEDTSDTYLFTQVLARMSGDSTDEKIKKTMALVPGAASVLIGIEDTLYAARDRKGMRPLVVGKLDDIWMIASETLAFDKAGARVVREILPGEIVRFDGDGMTVIQEGSKKNQQGCAWEEVYFMQQESKSNISPEELPPTKWVENDIIRRNIGLKLAEEEKSREEYQRHKAERNGTEFKPFKPDFVVPVPRSGLPFGKGYAEGMDVPLKELITKVTDERQFLDSDVEAIQGKVCENLVIHNPEIWKGKKVVLVDDSIVRGSVSKGLTKVLEELGAEVHWRSGLPMIMDTCHLGVSIREEKELIAARNKGDEAEIAKEIGAASVHYISDVGFNSGRRGELYVAPKPGEDVYKVNGLCGGCFSSGEGEYAYNREQRPSDVVDLYKRSIVPASPKSALSTH